jgi:hypothetical protein
MPAPNPSYPHLPTGHQPGTQSRRELKESNGVQRWVAERWTLDGVSIALRRTDYRRGETVEAVVQPRADASFTPLSAGLVCTERYWNEAKRYPDTDWATEWETWQELAPDTSLEQPVSLTIPAGGPYSHEGTVLSISWAVVVRERRRLRADKTYLEPIWIDP